MKQSFSGVQGVPQEQTPAIALEADPRGVNQEKIIDAVQAGVAGVALLFLSPLLLVISLAVKLTSPGPILYRGERVGQAGRLFLLNKFRTLRVGAEKHIGARLLNDQDTLYTRVGHFLRRTKLDELPQLWNVVKGEMRLVGPRPVRPIFLEHLAAGIPDYRKRFQVKPGMTGLAQVRGGYKTHPRNKLRYERHYISNRSIWFDIKLILLTLVKITHRWLTSSALLLVLFLFASFIPASFQSSFYVHAWGSRFNIIHGLIVLFGIYLLSRWVPRNRISIYRSPVYLPMGLFLLTSAVGAFFSIDGEQAWRGAAYYLVTGFAITVGIINSRLSRRFVRQAAGVVAATAVMISALGLLKLVLSDYLAFAGASFPGEMSRLYLGPGITATLDSPSALAAYLALAIPYLLYQLVQTQERHQRDLWMIGATLAFIGILLTKTPVGLCALILTVTLCASKYFRPRTLAVCLAGLSPFLVLSLYSARVSLAELFRLPVSAWSDSPTLSGIIPTLFGHGARTLYGFWADLQGAVPIPALPDSTYAVLLFESGIFGVLCMAWIVISSLIVIFRAYRDAMDVEIQRILWATLCATLGFLVSILGCNAFSNLALQVLFWGTLGVGLGVATHFNGKRKEFILDLKLGH